MVCQVLGVNWICSSTYQILLLFAPLIFCQMINLIFLLIVYPILFFRKINKDDRSDLIKQHIPLLFSILLAVVIYMVTLVNRLIIVTYDSNYEKLWIIHAIASSCWGFVSTVVIMLHMLALCCLQPKTSYERLRQSSSNQQIQYGSCDRVIVHCVPNNNLT